MNDFFFIADTDIFTYATSKKITRKNIMLEATFLIPLDMHSLSYLHRHNEKFQCRGCQEYFEIPFSVKYSFKVLSIIERRNPFCT